MNEQLKGRSADLALIDGRQIAAEQVTLSCDSVPWLEWKTAEVSTVVTRQLKSIVIKSHFIGALEGMGIGALVGGTLGLVLGSSGHESAAFGRSGMLAIGLIGVGGAGVVVGLIPGMIIGHSYDYEFPPTEISDPC